ncbi:MAG: 50S ribosomal protein L23 [Chloroflexi bacterium]|nr:50S ribosomal protein L23 [Chloroflexota bacterium]MDA8189825.1 50S ribosomal protein L23 [Dehalococcoidales bacterium]
MNIYEVLRRPIITEKGTTQTGMNKYVFEVATPANKLQIKEAVEKVFKVNVVHVNVINVPGKMRRVGKHRGMTSPWKKAIVTVREGQRIEMFEGA